MDIQHYPNPVLKTPAETVGDAKAIAAEAEEMVRVMHEHKGVGLAANQVGVLQRVVVVDLSGTDEGKGTTPLILLNPEVIAEEGEVAIEEGCLSLPDLRDEVDRPEKVTVRYRDLEFKEQRFTADGMLARVCQHEIDHLNGVLFFDRLGAVRRKLLTGRLNRMARGEVEVDYPVVGGIYVPPAPGVVKGPPRD